MGDNNNNQKRVRDESSTQQSITGFSLNAASRQRVIERIICSLKDCYGAKPGTVSDLEAIARKFEGRVYNVATSEQDYMKRIALKMHAVMANVQRPASSAMAAVAANGDPNPRVQSNNPSQPQPHLIVQTSTPFGAGIIGTSTTSPTSATSRLQGSSSISIGQNPNLLNASMMPPNMEAKTWEKHVPSSPVSAFPELDERLQQQQQQQLRRSQGRHLQPSLQRDVFLNAGKDTRSTSELHPQHSSSPPIKVSSPTVPLHGQSPLGGRSEPVASRAHPTISRQQYETWQRDIARQEKLKQMQQKSVPLGVRVKQEPVSEQSTATSIQKNRMPQRNTQNFPMEQQHHISQANRACEVEQVKLRSQPMQLANAGPHQLRVLNAPQTESQNIHYYNHETVPVVERGRLGVRQSPAGNSSPQAEQSQPELLAQLMPITVKVERSESPSVTSAWTATQDLQRPEARTNQLVHMDIEPPTRANALVARDRQGEVEEWREEVYRRITVMKCKYQERLGVLYYRIADKLKLADMQPPDPRWDNHVKRLKGEKVVAGRMLAALNVSKNDLHPGFRERIDNWEKSIVNFLRKFYKHVRGGEPLQQSVAPASNSPQVEQLEDRRNESHLRQLTELVQDKQRLVPQQQPATLQPEPKHDQLSEAAGARIERPLPIIQDGKLNDQQKLALKPSQNNPSGMQLQFTVDTPDKNVPAGSSPALEDIEVESQLRPSTPTSNRSSELAQYNGDNAQNIGKASENAAADQVEMNQAPVQRLLNAVRSMSAEAFQSAMDDMYAVMRMDDVMQTLAPQFTSEATVGALGEDLGAVAGCSLQARYGRLHEDGATTWVPRPQLIYSHINSEDSVMESSNECHCKRPRHEFTLKSLLQEVNAVNNRLIDIIVDICKEDTVSSHEGTVVKCRYIGASVDQKFMKSIAPSGNLYLIEPVRLLVPTDYPVYSPVVLDKLRNDDSSDDLSSKARARFETSLKGLYNPFSLAEMVKTWEVCARDVIIEYAGKFGGGTFSSRFGAW